MMCRVYEVSRAGYYAWQGRAPSDRAQERGRLVAAIERVHAASGETYGSPRVTRALRQSGYTVGENRVARLMRERCLKARPRASIARTGHSCLLHQYSESAIGDLGTAAGSGLGRGCHLLEGRRGLALPGRGDGQVVAPDCGLELGSSSVCEPDAAGLKSRRRQSPAARRFDLPHRSRHRVRCACLSPALGPPGFIQSMNRPQRMNDNAHMESFFHSLKSESIHGKTFVDDREAIAAVCSYLPYYNHSRCIHR
jgi:putative transposase